MPTQSFYDHFEGYEILGEIDRSNARVLRARNKATGEIVAIKHFDLTADPSTLKRFQQESEIMLSIDNPFVVKVKDVKFDAEIPFIAMEFIEGGSLRKLLVKGEGLDVHIVIRLGLQMAEALKAIHAKGTVHRDIKPENILYRTQTSRELHFLLTDFGISKVTSAAVSYTGKDMMTWEYASPERFSDPNKVSFPTDYYSLGVVLYECLTGKVPFALEEGKLLTHMTNVTTHPHPPLVLPNSSMLPPSLLTLVNGLLEKDPEKRVKDYMAMLRLLKRAELEAITGEETVTNQHNTYAPQYNNPPIVTMPAGNQPNKTESSVTQAAQPLKPPPVIISKTDDPIKKEKKEKEKSAFPAWGISLIVLMAIVVILILIKSKSTNDDTSATVDSTTVSSPDSAKMLIDTSKMSRDNDYIKMDTTIRLPSNLSVPYSEDFSTDKGKWITETTDDRKIGILDNQYVIEALNEQHSYHSDNLFDIDTDKDFTFSTYVHWLSGINDNGFGVDFCSNSDANNFLSFEISANGSFIIEYLKDNKWNIIKAWTPSESIKKDSEWNKLKITKEGSTLYFYINDENVYSSDNIELYGKTFGFRVESKQKVAFDDFSLTGTP